MKLGTKASIVGRMGTMACMALVALNACDRGVAPVCNDGDTTCVALGDVSGTSSGTGSTNGSGSTKNDSSTTGTTGTGGSTSATWDPVYDTGTNIKTVAKTDFIGIPSILGGDARRIAFYVTDSTLHITASSDAINFGETFYDVRVLCTDSIQFGWDSKTDNGLFPNAATGTDPLTVLEMPVIDKALEAHLTARSGSTFLVWVKARSGYRLRGNTVAVPEDSLPRLNISQTRALLVSGISLNAIPSDPFRILIP